MDDNTGKYFGIVKCWLSVKPRNNVAAKWNVLQYSRDFVIVITYRVYCWSFFILSWCTLWSKDPMETLKIIREQQLPSLLSVYHDRNFPFSEDKWVRLTMLCFPSKRKILNKKQTNAIALLPAFKQRSRILSNIPEECKILSWKPMKILSLVADYIQSSTNLFKSRLTITLL